MATSMAGKLREQIQPLISSVPDAGEVHLYRRNLTDWTRYLNLFQHQLPNGRKVIRGWTITRAGFASLTSVTGQISHLFSFGQQARPYIFLIEGICALEDATASELAWEEIVELVQDNLDKEQNLGGLAENYGVGPSLMQSWEERQFGSVLCHSVSLLYPVEAPRSISYG